MKQYEHYRQRVGLAQIGQQNLPPAPIKNPFAKGRDWNLSAQFEIEKRDPGLAARLRSLAGE